MNLDSQRYWMLDPKCLMNLDSQLMSILDSQLKFEYFHLPLTGIFFESHRQAMCHH